MYDEVITHQLIAYTLDDGRTVKVSFTAKGNETNVTEIFEAEGQNPVDIQQAGWQAILDNFKKYAETH